VPPVTRGSVANPRPHLDPETAGHSGRARKCQYPPVASRCERGEAMVTVNVVVLAGTIAADPVERQLPSGDEITELKVSVPEAGKKLLPLPVAAWHKTSGLKRALKDIVKGDQVLVQGQL